MSALTKVLVVLLTVFSIFLCGIVVTYVANADNQRERAEQALRRVRQAEASAEDAMAQEEQQKQAAAAKETELGQEIADLQVSITRLQAQIDTLKRENSQLVQEVTNMGAAVRMANETAAKLRDQAAAAEQEVGILRAEQSDRNKELQEKTQALMERIAVIADLEKKNRQLIEERQGFESQLGRTLQRYGRAPTRPQTVTPAQGAARPAQPPVQGTREIDLNARVTQVDLANKVAAISIGSAAGVREGMEFLVRRGDDFICKIVIFDVDPDKAIGTLGLIQANPRAGDLVATNL